MNRQLRLWLPLCLMASCLTAPCVWGDQPTAPEKSPEKPSRSDDGGQKSAAPLSPEQIERVRALVRSTQARDAELKGAIDAKQRELAAAYSAFELDEARVTAIEEEIVGLQRQLLTNYHALHVELRKIVGPERFAILIQRINAVLKTPAERPKSESPSKSEGSPIKDPPKR